MEAGLKFTRNLIVSVVYYKTKISKIDTSMSKLHKNALEKHRLNGKISLKFAKCNCLPFTLSNNYY